MSKQNQNPPGPSPKNPGQNIPPAPPVPNSVIETDMAVFHNPTSDWRETDARMHEDIARAKRLYNEGTVHKVMTISDKDFQRLIQPATDPSSAVKIVGMEMSVVRETPSRPGTPGTVQIHHRVNPTPPHEMNSQSHMKKE